MKSLINYYHETDPITDDMTEAKPSYVGMAIALGFIADPDYRYKLEGFSCEEVRQIKANVEMRMRANKAVKIYYDTTHFLGDHIGEG